LVVLLIVWFAVLRNDGEEKSTDELSMAERTTATLETLETTVVETTITSSTTLRTTTTTTTTETTGTLKNLSTATSKIATTTYVTTTTYKKTTTQTKTTTAATVEAMTTTATTTHSGSDPIGISIVPITGQVNTYGGSVDGVTIDYVSGNDSYEVERHLEDEWHITAKNVYYSYGIIWLECWDTDDGDYYGWIDSNYINFDNISLGDWTILSFDGEVNTHGGSVDGVTTSYVYGDEENYTVERHVEDGWNVVIENVYYSYGIVWLECWDADDGDYYGWIDSYYIDLKS